MKLGDTIRFAWTAEYAPEVHFGTSNMPGRYWVSEAVANWQGYVDDASRRAQAIR